MYLSATQDGPRLWVRCRVEEKQKPSTSCPACVIQRNGPGCVVGLVELRITLAYLRTRAMISVFIPFLFYFFFVCSFSASTPALLEIFSCAGASSNVRNYAFVNLNLEMGKENNTESNGTSVETVQMKTHIHTHIHFRKGNFPFTRPPTLELEAGKFLAAS